MARAERSLRLHTSRNALAWLGMLLVLGVYLALPEASSTAPREVRAESAEEGERLEISLVSPHDPYPGGTISISFAGAPGPLEVFANKTRLRILARRGEQIVAELPRDFALGDVKVRLVSLPDDATRVRSKPFHIRVRTPSYRKLYRSFVGGVALVVLGVFFLARGVRGATSLQVARLLATASKKRGLLFGIGSLLGALAQTTTGAIGVLSGLVSSRVLGAAPATLAALAAPLGAALMPLLVAGLIEPRDGLLIVALGVVWLSLAHGRRWRAMAGLLLGSGLLAFGLHIFRPALEPLLADATLWRLAGDLRAEGPLDLMLCAGIGALAVMLLHGPAPLIVLLLGIAQATQHADLRTLLALSAGTSAGAAGAGLITAPASPGARVFAKAHLCLGVLGSAIALLTVELWLRSVNGLLGPMLHPLHWTERAPVSELGLRLCVGFGLSQLLVWLVLAPLVPRVCALASTHKAAHAASDAAGLRARFDQVLCAQREALQHTFSLAASGARQRGHEAEQTLGRARQTVESLLARPRPEPNAAALESVTFSLLQLQNALDHLLQQTEMLVDAQVAGLGEERAEPGRAFESEPLAELHRLLAEGLEAARSSLCAGEPLDIDAARAREIQMNRIEAAARGALLTATPQRAREESRLRVLQVVDAYEATGNQAYRLAELLSQGADAAYA